MKLKIDRGTLNIKHEGQVTLADLAEMPEVARGAGIPPTARVTYLSLSQDRHVMTGEQHSTLMVGWELDSE